MVKRYGKTIELLKKTTEFILKNQDIKDGLYDYLVQKIEELKLL